MTERRRKSSILGFFLPASLILLGLCASVVAQGNKTDPSSVNHTVVTSIGPVPAASGSSHATPPPVHKAAFSGSPYIVGSVVTPTTTGPEAEEHIAVDPNNSSALVSTISDFSRPLAGFLVNTTKLATSSDNGTTWLETFVPEGNDGRPMTSDGLSWDANSDPVVAVDKLGNVFAANLYINFVSQSNDGFYVSKGTITNSGLQISATNAVATNAQGSPNSEDKEWLTVDNSNSAFSGNVYVCWTRFTATDNHIRVARSTDHGDTWGSSMQVSPASQNGAVQGCQVAVGPSGEVYVAWEVFFINGLRQHFFVKSTDGGMTFNSAKSITSLFREVIFQSGYRKNSFPALAVSPVNGNVADVFSAFTSPGGTKVLFTQSTNGGSSFSNPFTLVDVFGGVQFFPAVAYDEAGTMHASWFDTRNSGSAQAAQFDVYATFSSDNGATFAPNARVTPTQVFAGKFNSFIGDYSGITAAGGFAHPVWNNGGFVSLATNLQTATLTLP
jgi:uncharacterized membrane protein